MKFIRIKEIIKESKRIRILLLSGLIGLVVFPLLVIFHYRDLIEVCDYFELISIDNEAIVEVGESNFKVGRGHCKILSIESLNNDLPILLANSKEEDKIIVGGVISKISDSEIFRVSDGNQTYLYEIRDLRKGRNLFIVGIFIAIFILIIGTLYLSLKKTKLGEELEATQAPKQ